MKPSYTVSSVEDLPKYPAIALTTATLELEVDGVKSKFSAFQWRKKALDDQGVEAVIFLSHGYAEYLTRDSMFSIEQIAPVWLEKRLEIPF